MEAVVYSKHNFELSLFVASKVCGRFVIKSSVLKNDVNKVCAVALVDYRSF